MSYKQTLSDLLSDDFKRFAGLIETVMMDDHRTLNHLPRGVFADYARRAEATGTAALDTMRNDLVAHGEMNADY